MRGGKKTNEIPLFFIFLPLQQLKPREITLQVIESLVCWFAGQGTIVERLKGLIHGMLDLIAVLCRVSCVLQEHQLSSFFEDLRKSSKVIKVIQSIQRCFLWSFVKIIVEKPPIPRSPNNQSFDLGRCIWVFPKIMGKPPNSSICS